TPLTPGNSYFQLAASSWPDGTPLASTNAEMLMSYKFLELSPLGTPDTQMRIAIAWNAPPMSLEDVEVLRSWVVYDSEVEGQERRMRWNAVLGLAVALGISAGFWTGVGLLMAHFLS